MVIFQDKNFVFQGLRIQRSEIQGRVCVWSTFSGVQSSFKEMVPLMCETNCGMVWAGHGPEQPKLAGMDFWGRGMW